MLKGQRLRQPVSSFLSLFVGQTVSVVKVNPTNGEEIVWPAKLLRAQPKPLVELYGRLEVAPPGTLLEAISKRRAPRPKTTVSPFSHGDLSGPRIMPFILTCRNDGRAYPLLTRRRTGSGYLAGWSRAALWRRTAAR